MVHQKHKNAYNTGIYNDDCIDWIREIRNISAPPAVALKTRFFFWGGGWVFPDASWGTCRHKESARNTSCTQILPIARAEHLLWIDRIDVHFKEPHQIVKIWIRHRYKHFKVMFIDKINFTLKTSTITMLVR